MAIKAIIFDIGGILVEEPAEEARKIIAKKYNFSLDDFSIFFKKYLSYSYAGWHHYAFFQKLVEELKLNISYKDLANDWLKIREEKSFINEDNLILLKALQKNYITGVLSNSTFLNEEVSARKEIKKYFEKNLFLLSCEIGFRKPDKNSYLVLIEKLNEKNISSEETIFIDDREENIVPAKELGLKTVLYKSNEQLKNELINLGVEI